MYYDSIVVLPCVWTCPKTVVNVPWCYHVFLDTYCGITMFLDLYYDSIVVLPCVWTCIMIVYYHVLDVYCGITMFWMCIMIVLWYYHAFGHIL